VVEKVPSLQVTFVGIVRQISQLSTNTGYAIEDGTGLIDVRFWNDGDDSGPNQSKAHDIT
jgi:replication factor A2